MRYLITLFLLLLYVDAFGAAHTMYVNGDVSGGDSSGDSWTNAVNLAEFEDDLSGTTCLNSDASCPEAGDIYYVLGGQDYAFSTINQSADGATDNPISIIGIASAVPGDMALAEGDDRPNFVSAAQNNFQLDNFYEIYNFIFNSDHTGYTLTLGFSSIYNSKIINTGSTAYAVKTEGLVQNCDVSSTGAGGAGSGAVSLTSIARVKWSYIHDSYIGIIVGNGDATFNILDSNDIGIEVISGYPLILNNTIYGGATPTAPVGISLTAAMKVGGTIENNSISDMTTCITAATQQVGGTIDYNNFHACTTPRTNVDAGDNDTTADPGYADETGTPPDFSTTTGIVGTGRSITLGVD